MSYFKSNQENYTGFLLPLEIVIFKNEYYEYLFCWGGSAPLFAKYLLK